MPFNNHDRTVLKRHRGGHLMESCIPGRFHDTIFQMRSLLSRRGTVYPAIRTPYQSSPTQPINPPWNRTYIGTTLYSLPRGYYPGISL
ncbi:hypothetical protein M422DRAFT_25610, partial [Sphaerobolus stellatus SS14]